MHATSLSDLATGLANAPIGAVRSILDTALLVLEGSAPPWQPTGLRVRAGQAYSVFAAGRLQWSARDPSLYGGPRYHLWLRVSPGGQVRNLRAESDTFIADVDGEIETGIYMGVWRDAAGALATGPELYTGLAGRIEALVITWQRDAVTGLTQCADVDDWFAGELAHQRQARGLPTGWQLLLETGETHLFTAGEAAHGRPSIRLAGEDDQGILCREVDIALTPATTLTWSWRLSAHPSALAEDRVRCHDYISIGAEFDNGRDLTWFWSACLPPEHHFACPVKAWSARETHLVVRSGMDGLGQWQTERRAVRSDVAKSMGAPPSRLVRVWLIAVASFQHGRLAAEFADISLSNGDEHWQVL